MGANLENMYLGKEGANLNGKVVLIFRFDKLEFMEVANGKFWNVNAVVLDMLHHRNFGWNIAYRF